MTNHEIVSADRFRALTCRRCDHKLDVRSYFLPIKMVNVDKYGNELDFGSCGMEIHVRCTNSNCDESNHEKNPDYFTPIFVGAI